jgi:hypothetical protein
VSRPARRLVITSLLALALAACASDPGGAPSPEPSPTPTPTPAPVETPTITPAPTASPVDQGNVDRLFPELGVEIGGPGYVVHVIDPTAKVWRLSVSGVGALAGERLEVIVEIGDVAPGAEARIYTDGRLMDIIDMSGMLGRVVGESAAAGGCHPTLQLCVDSGGISIDLASGDASFVLERIEEGAFEIVGSTADWPGEPFIPGPWRTTDAFSTY